MDSTIQALAGILLKAVPTLLLVILLHFYFKTMLFGPLEKVRKARYEATEGARQAAQQALQRAAKRAEEYDAALTAARGEMYKEQEELRKRWRSEQEQAISQSREHAQAAIRKAREEIAAESAGAKQKLRASSELLAAQIASRVVGGRLQ